MRRLPVLLALILVPALAEAQSGVQWTRERDATLVSKDVGPERWAITYRLSDGRVTGNVFRTDGGPTSFLDCTQTSLVDGTATYDCYGADACAEAPCPESQYTLIQSGISLPLDFFFPPGDTPGSGTLADLVGSWRFVIDDGDGQTETTYRLDRVEEDDGEEIVVGEAEDGNDVFAFAEGDRFVLIDETDFQCRRYEFDFVGINRLEGTREIALVLPIVGDCDDVVVDDDPFFAERIFG